MNKFQRALFSKTCASVFAVLAALAPLFFYASRSNQHVFLDNALFSGFSQMLFWLIAANAIAATAWAALAFKKRDLFDSHSKAMTAACAITDFFTAAFCILNIVLLISGGEETAPVVLRGAAGLAPYALLYFAIVFFALFFPEIKHKIARVAIVSLVGVALVLGAVLTVYSPAVYGFVSDPMVLDTGSDYSIVFATTDEGTGFVEYEYEGETYRVYDQKQGKIESDSRVHSVRVPYEHLDNNSYTVGSMQVYEPYAYGSRSGKTIVSEEYAFTPCDGETQTWLCVSDWHTRNDLAKDAIAYLGDYDGVILLGDASPDLGTEDELVRYLVEFGGDLGGGTMPIVYTRGNHETRGAYAPYLADALGLDEFYFEVKAGDYRFVVLDSGEDKEDSHPEYGGLADFAAYRAENVDWVETLTEDGKTIALCHSPRFFIEEDLTDRTIAALTGIKTSAALTGHWHYCDLDTETYPDLPVFIDGGHKDGAFVASRVTLSPSGIALFACDDGGAAMMDETLPWLN